MTLPNQLTILRIILTPVFAVTLMRDEMYFKYISLIIFIVASLTDWYDGYVARKFGVTTETGKYLDPLADKLLITTSFAIFAHLNYIALWMFWVIALRDVAITGLRWYATTTNKKFETNNFAKWKTATQMLTIYLLLFWIILEQKYASLEDVPTSILAIQDWNVIWNIMLFVTLYTLLSGMLYLFENRSLLKSLAIACYRVFVPTNVR